ncbi:MFS transporter, partial [Verminephrobacter aporrectodeae]
IPELPGATWLLSLAQALNLTCAVISVTVAAIVGARLAASPALATVPYGAQFASVMVCTFPASMLMRRLGRRVVFTFGALVLICAGLLGFVAVARGSFVLLTAAHVALGMYVACANFYRFAAVDDVEPTAKARAISVVVAGGVLAAVAGPAIADWLKVVPGYADFSLCYAAFSVLGVATLLLMAAWRPRTASAPAAAPIKFLTPMTSTAGAPLDSNLAVGIAIFCSAGGYFLMNLLMVQASLVMKDICSFSATSDAIEIHVLAMFVPSFVTGLIIARVGLKRTLMAGFFLLGAAMTFGSLVPSYAVVVASLTLLGLGWNLTYVGGGALLAQNVPDRSRHRWQGVNDTVIAACATLGALLPAPMMAVFGWNRSNVLLSSICVAGLLLCWRGLPRATPGLLLRTAGTASKP